MKYLFTIILLMIVFKVHSQECEHVLLGEVIDFHDNTTLQEATIIAIETKKTVMTNMKGMFQIEGLCNGELSLQVSHPNCTTRLIKVNIDGDTTVSIKLEHHLEELSEVHVSSKANPKKTNSSIEQRISNDRLEVYSASALGDALKEINGVSSLNTGAHIVKPVIQGLNGSRVVLLNNGVRMQDMEWGDEHAPNVDVNSVGNITIIKGASALRYGGDAIGGVILLEPERIHVKDSLFGKTILSGATNGRGGTLTSTLTRSYENGWFAKGQFSYKRFGDSEAPDYILSNTGIDEKAVSLNFGKRSFYKGWDVYYSFYKANIAILAASHIGNVDDLIRAINSKQSLIVRNFTYDIDNPSQEVTHHLGKLNYFKRFEGLGKFELQYDFQHNQRFEFDIRRGDNSSKPAIDLTLTTHTITSNFNFDKNSALKVNTGILARYQNNFADPSTDVRRLIPDYNKYDFGVYLTGKYKSSEAITLDVGIRYDYNHINAKKFYQISRWEERNYDIDFNTIIIEDEDYGTEYLTNPVFDFHSLSATIGANYTFNNNKELLFNYSLSQRSPNPSELFSDGLHHSAARIEQGDLRNEQETSHKLSLALSSTKDNFSWEVSPYLNRINNFILLEPTGDEFTNRGAFPLWEYRQTDAILLGIDARANKQWNEWIGTEHGFSLVKGKESNGSPIINMPPASIKNKLVFRKENWKSLNTSIESIYTFSQNEYPDNIYVFSLEANEEVELDVNTPPDAYHLLNANADITLKISAKSNLNLGLGINNILNKRYRNYLNRLRYFADERGRNILITLKLNY